MPRLTSQQAVIAGQMKHKKYDIKIVTDNDAPLADEAKGVLYFEDRDKFQQDAIIDLLTSIIKNKYNQGKENI